MGLYEDMEVVAADANERADSAVASAAPAAFAPDECLHEKIQKLAQGFSIEIVPRTAQKVKHFANVLPEHSRVFIPFLPASRFADCVPLAIRLRREGMEPVPHIAARRVASHTELRETLGRLRGEAGVTECLVIAGDPKSPVGPFADSLAVLETGLLETCGIQTIFVGGQPGGIPGVAREAVDRALLRKNDYARSTAASVHLVSQFTLDIQALASWRNRLAQLGNRLPLHIGIAGPTSLTTLLKFAALTGASASLRAMRRYGAKLTQLATEAAPDALIAHLAHAQPSPLGDVADTPAGPDTIAGLHVYTFGGFSQSAAWMTALQRGEFALKPNGAGFEVGSPLPTECLAAAEG